MTVSSPGPYRVHLLAIVLVALTAVASSGHRVRAQVRPDAPKFVFAVHIPGVETGFFRQVSGLGVETDVIEYQEGGSSHVRKLPGRTRWKNIVLKRGFTGDAELYDWALARTATGDAVKRQITISMLDQAGNRVATWTFTDAWPVKWELSELDAAKNEVAIETLEIAHEGLSWSRDE